jgi:hypothetical protein
LAQLLLTGDYTNNPFPLWATRVFFGEMAIFRQLRLVRLRYLFTEHWNYTAQTSPVTL